MSMLKLCPKRQARGATCHALMHTVVAAMLAAACQAAIAGEPVTIVGMAKAIDGDTVEIRGERVRIHGIDAPEAAQTCDQGGQTIPCGQEATEALARKMGRNQVTCTGTERDRYDRLIAVCLVGDIDLGSWLIEQGRAVAFLKYSRDYVAVEQRAKEKKAGIWSTTFLMPWDYRAQLASAVPADAPNPKCLIKGNISAKGEKIYHLPGGAMYAKTDVKPARGERWFCTPQEAEAAGWRASKR